MDLTGVLLLGGRVTDDGAQRDDRGLGGLGLRSQERGVELLDVFDVFARLGPVHALGVPAVGLVALENVFSERDVGVVLDGDMVLVIDHHEVAQFLVPGQGGSLRGHAFLEVAVGGNDPDGVVERAGPGRRIGVEQATHPALGVGEAHRGGQTLTQRPSGDFHALGVLVFRVSGGQRTPGAQGFQIAELQAVAGKEQLDIQGQRGVPG